MDDIASHKLSIGPYNNYSHSYLKENSLDHQLVSHVAQYDQDPTRPKVVNALCKHSVPLHRSLPKT